MKVLLIYAHPEPRSLNGALKNFAVRHLQQAGHEVQVSDLYAMRWKAGYDADDSGAPPVGEFWRPTLDSKQAFAQGTQSADIAAEQEKLLWADTVIFQFPLWWFSMPAIMKGWIDRGTPGALPMASASTATATGGIATGKALSSASGRC